ncbi:MAG: acyl-CoA thioesterase [Arcobacter sp.]|nr:acyl-CoA thioesterase [Arcobacter sp.]
MIEFKTNMKVEFYDTDAMGIVWHGHYVKFLERARCDFLDFVGYDYYKMGQDGYMFPIIKLDLKYIKPARFKDEIQIQVNLLEFESCLKFKYILTNAKTGEKLATASSSQACVKIGNTKLEFQTPKHMQEIFKKVIK